MDFAHAPKNLKCHRSISCIWRKAKYNIMKIVERKTRFVESCPELAKRFFRGAPVRTELHFGPSTYSLRKKSRVLRALKYSYMSLVSLKFSKEAKISWDFYANSNQRQVYSVWFLFQSFTFFRLSEEYDILGESLGVSQLWSAPYTNSVRLGSKIWPES